MENWQYLLVAAAGCILLLLLTVSAVRKHRERKQRDFTRKLETLLQPKETIRVICPQKGSHFILTNKRIIFEKKGDFAAYPLKTVQRVQGKNKEGNRTTAPAKMVTLTIKMDHEVILKNTGAEFEELAKLLQDKIKKQNEKKKAVKEKR